LGVARFFGLIPNGPNAAPLRIVMFCKLGEKLHHARAYVEILAALGVDANGETNALIGKAVTHPDPFRPDCMIGYRAKRGIDHAEACQAWHLLRQVDDLINMKRPSQNQDLDDAASAKASRIARALGGAKISSIVLAVILK
jgi:hypothetical protein